MADQENQLLQLRNELKGALMDKDKDGGEAE
jgi:hypothetical protein